MEKQPNILVMHPAVDKIVVVRTPRVAALSAGKHADRRAEIEVLGATRSYLEEEER